jgi:lipooligosaccharide transport system ATP-binding protein
VLLDEPTVGLDPQVRQELWSLIDGLRTSGVTVLMSTHYIEEAERLADTVAVMSHGRIIAQGSPVDLVRAHAGEEVLEVYGVPERLAEVSDLALRNGWSSRRRGPAVAIMRAERLGAGELDGDALDGVRRPANLEDAFVALTGEEIE